MNGIIIHNHELSEYWLDMLREIRSRGASADILALHPIGGKNAVSSLDGLIRQTKTPEFIAFLQKAYDIGISVEYEMHTLSLLLPREKFSYAPNWFRENEKGERTPDANMCASNDDALDFIEERSALLARLLPQRGNRYFYWLDDISGLYCHCDKCRELSPSDQALKITNRILRGIRRTNPNATLPYLAYRDTMRPPLSIRPEEGIFLEYAPIKRELARPISDPECEKNASELKHIEALLDYFGKEGAQVLEYWMDNSLNSGWRLPYKKLPFYPDVIRSDVTYYRELGFQHITSFGCFLSEEYAKEFGRPPVLEYFDILSGK